MAIDRLREQVERDPPRLLYLIPTYQNPVGGVLSLIAERLELASELLSSLLPAWSWDRPHGGL